MNGKEETLAARTRPVASEHLFTPQEYTDAFFGVCAAFTGKRDELRDWLDRNGHSGLWDFSLMDTDEFIEGGAPGVLVDTTYIDEDCRMMHELRWFEIPGDIPGAGTGEEDSI